MTEIKPDAGYKLVIKDINLRLYYASKKSKWWLSVWYIG